ncbi:hypothetical protein, partial [Rhizobium metallidurans]|uniref:hypothetical protein n=1 Tax=Rhizobium metallidurans TaxID=1265931 RepID=UPI001AED79A9
DLRRLIEPDIASQKEPVRRRRLRQCAWKIALTHEQNENQNKFKYRFPTKHGVLKRLPQPCR